MPHAKNTSVKEKKVEPIRLPDFGEEEEVVAPEEKADGAVVEEAESDENAQSDDEELDANELNPFGDKWEE